MGNKTKKQIRVVSPDGFAIERDVYAYKSRTAAMGAFKEWAARFKQQGYYSSTKHGKIHLLDLEDFCEFIEVQS